MTPRSDLFSRRAFIGGAAAAIPAIAASRRALGQDLPQEDQQAGGEVDVALLLLIDASASISDRILRFQLQGHAAALRQPSIVEAIANGPTGQIAIAAMSYSDPGRQSVFVPWRIVNGEEGTHEVADVLAARADDMARGSTAIGGALLAGLNLFRESSFQAARRIIDLSGNGFNNSGPPPDSVHPALNEREITVNGLAIVNEYPWLGTYFEERVVTGPGAFVREVFELEDYETALTQKMVREIV